MAGFELYGAGAGPWVCVDSGIIWLDDVLLNSPGAGGIGVTHIEL